MLKSVGLCGLLWCTVFLMLASDLPATHRALDMADAVGVESPALNQASTDIPFILQGSLNGTHFGGIKLDAIKCMVIFRDFP